MQNLVKTHSQQQLAFEVVLPVFMLMHVFLWILFIRELPSTYLLHVMHSFGFAYLDG